jgi:signal transduction histidine kinase
MTRQSSSRTTKVDARAFNVVILMLARMRAIDPFRADLLLAAVFFLEVIGELVFLVPDGAQHTRAALALNLALGFAIAIRRRWPIVSALVAMPLLIGFNALGSDYADHTVSPFLAELFLLYSMGRNIEGSALYWVLAYAVVCSLISLTTDAYDDGPGSVVFTVGAVVFGPALLGRVLRNRAALNRTLHDKARALRRDRAQSAAAAAGEERARIAGELHHLVSAALASMVGQAGAAETLVRDKPEVAEKAFASVETTGREALAEIRQLLGVLRRDDEELALAPQPSLTHIRDLVARARAAGLPVELAVEGEHGPLPAGVDLTAYRVIQEALDGALEAPDDRRATVRLRYGETHVALEVTDAGDARPGPERRLLGVRERVALYGGELVAEPTDGSGYAVRARLPLERVA